MKVRNYYEILEIDPFSSQAEIKRAYLAKIKAYHPDKKNGCNSFAHKRFQVVLEAYEALKTNERREKYDEMLKIQISHELSEKREKMISQNDNAPKQKKNFFSWLIRASH